MYKTTTMTRLLHNIALLLTIMIGLSAVIVASLITLVVLPLAIPFAWIVVNLRKLSR